MYIPFKKLVQMLSDAYNAGRKLPSDMRTQAVEEIIVEHNVMKAQIFRIYTVDELHNFPVAAKFCHSLLGNGEVASKQGLRTHFMKFDSGVTHSFSADAFPWDMPMLYLGE